MNIFKENLWERIFNRLPESEANDAVRHLKAGGSYKDIDFFTLKAAEEQVEHHRLRFRDAMADYRAHKAGRSVQRFFAVFRDREGLFLREHARNMATLARDSRRDFHDLSNEIMKSIANDDDLPPTLKKGGKNE